MPPIELVVGLGNPGPQYARTRHNAGFMALDAFARKHGVAVEKRAHKGLLGEMRWPTVPAAADRGTADRGARRIVLLKPQTFMNLSGESVVPALRWHRTDPARMLVIYDDLDLPFGRLRLREHGSSGGHNGMNSIIEQLGTSDFPRLRVGIGRPPEGVAVPDFVLRPFLPTEQERLPDVLARAVAAIEAVLTDGVPAAMNVVNASE